MVSIPKTRINVLLTEDDDGYASMVGADLEGSDAGIRLQRARTLHDATRLLAREPFDAVLLDLGLPDSSGLETVDRIRAVAPDVPIVVVTAHDDDVVALQAVQRGAQDYLVKSRVDAYTLTRAIRYARERSELRRNLLDREARFRALVEHSSDAVTLVDENLVSLYNSRSVERVLGYTPEELSGRKLILLIHPDDMPEIGRQFAESAANPGRAFPLEYRYRHKDGSWHWGEATIVNRLSDPVVRAIVLNHRDITPRKEAEEALRRSEEQLRQAHKMEAVGRLAGGVAHDFNNVLTAIFGYADLLLDQFPDDDPRSADLHEIRRSAERAASLTRQLLAFSRKQVMQPRVLDLNEILLGLEKLMRRLVGEDIVVEIRTERDLWEVRADPGQVEQVLMNLAANARDAMPGGGRLLVQTSNFVIGGADLPGHPGLSTGEYAGLIVTDTGEGIPEPVRQHVFEPFFTTKEQGKGTGLGLATVYGIVKQSGGGIYLESGDGKGTRFRILLPRVPIPESATSSP